MLRWLAVNPTAMDPGDVRAIIDTAVRTLSRVPMTIDGTDEFFDYLEAFGCDISGTKVRFPDAVIEETLNRIADYGRQRASAAPETPATRDADASLVLGRIPKGEAPREVTWSVSGQALLISDTRDDRLRKCTRADLATLSRVVEAIPGLGRNHPGLIPQDVPLRTQELHAFATIVLNSSEPCRVSLYSPEALPFYMRIMEVVCGSSEAAEAKARELLPCKVWVNTPMMISRENIEAPMLFRKMTGHPLTFSSMPVAGIATPVTPAGALALITAEVLAVNAIALAVDDAVAGWTAAPLFFDMKSGIHTQFGPETMLLMAGSRHVARELFGHEGPPFVTLSVAAKVPGPQSVLERAVQIAYNFALGARHFGGLSTLHSSDVVSTVQLMLDMEMVSLFRHAARGFEVTPEALAEDLIAEVAPQGARFMETDHTARHYRERSWFPEFLDRRVPMAWVKEPKDILEPARAKALELERTAPNRSTLSATQRREVEKILTAADRELG